jgi:hypothetical protein
MKVSKKKWVPYLAMKKKVYLLVLEQRKVGKKRSYFKELE